MCPQAARVPRLTDPELRCETLSEDTHWETGCRGNSLVGLQPPQESKRDVVEGRLKRKKKKHCFKALRMHSSKAEMFLTA